MFTKKFFLISTYLFSFLTLNGCVQSTASLLGPSMAVVKTGNISQASLSYVSNNIIKKKTGTTPGEYVVNLFNQNLSKNPILHSVEYLDKKKNIKFSISNSNTDVEHQKFLLAVKKMLK